MKYYIYCLLFLSAAMMTGCTAPQPSPAENHFICLGNLHSQPKLPKKLTLQNCLVNSNNKAETVKSFFALAQMHYSAAALDKALEKKNSPELRSQLIEILGKKAEASVRLSNSINSVPRHDLQPDFTFPSQLTTLQLPEIGFMEKCALLAAPEKNTADVLKTLHLRYIKLLTAREQAENALRLPAADINAELQKIKYTIRYQMELHLLCLLLNIKNFDAQHQKRLREKIFLLEQTLPINTKQR